MEGREKRGRDEGETGRWEGWRGERERREERGRRRKQRQYVSSVFWGLLKNMASKHHRPNIIS
jgi:hypothetical protein